MAAHARIRTAMVIRDSISRFFPFIRQSSINSREILCKMNARSLQGGKILAEAENEPFSTGFFARGLGPAVLDLQPHQPTFVSSL